MTTFVKNMCTPARTRYCLHKNKKKVCFENLSNLVHYWGPKVDVYDPKELSEYSRLCLQLYDDQNYHE